MKEYELTVLFHPDLEMNLEPALDKVRQTIQSNGGEIIKEEVEGKKHLAYTIKGHSYAIYYFVTINLPAEAPEKLSSTFNINDEVVRYLLVRADGRRAKVEAKSVEKAEESAEEENTKANEEEEK